ncbi:MAG: YicC/YloC family endoribonuclease [Burkholderiaceae bacterium]
MAVYSMTGYATLHSGPAPADTPPCPVLGLEVRSVNSRFLDITFKLSDELRGAEPALRELLGSELRRGKVEVRAWVEGRHEGGLKVPTTAELQKLVSIQDGVKAWLPTAAPFSVAEVLGLTSRQTASPVGLPEELLKLAKTGVDALKAARAREGGRLAAMLSGHVAQLAELAAQAKPMVPKLVEQQRQRFLDRWQEALGAATPVDSDAARDRALSEATAFAIRIDVAEELTRLASHLDEIARLLKAGGELGKRLDFLIQELHREANTLGSKSSSMDLTRISVDMKVLIEQMREQVQNLE